MSKLLDEIQTDYDQLVALDYSEEEARELLMIEALRAISNAIESY